MTPRLMRVAYVFEFLVALVAIFTAWSEIGGQGALDLMHWGWKTGLAVAIATSTVGFTAAIAAQDQMWTLRAARWLGFLVFSLVITGLVTYYYALQVDLGDSEDSGIVSTMLIKPVLFRPAA